YCLDPHRGHASLSTIALSPTSASRFLPLAKRSTDAERALPGSHYRSAGELAPSHKRRETSLQSLLFCRKICPQTA
ncbi:MAG TPA: hypothetical protein VKK81_08545, partial [Candidatus Binatia bacterium]|nr:hypothetical protein [Candidatus Binatia bacterium]